MISKPLLSSFRQVSSLKATLNLNTVSSNISFRKNFKASQIIGVNLKSYSTSIGSEFDFAQSKKETQGSGAQKIQSTQDSGAQKTQSAQDSGAQKTQSTHDNETFTDSKDFACTNDEWSSSFYGVGSKSFDKEVIDILLAPIDPKDIEIKPDGLLYLPEIKYRRILNRAFGPGAWGLVPRGPSTVTSKNLSREYALICLGRFVSQARGEQDYFDRSDISVSAEGARSNALTRCCKDLGIASELWDPSFIRKFKAENCEQIWAEHTSTKKRRLLWRMKDNPIEYPYRLC